MMPSLTRPHATATAPAPSPVHCPDGRHARPLCQAGADVRSREHLLLGRLRRASSGRLSPARGAGGARRRGLSLAGVAQEQRRLGYHAAPTALAINMHLYWTGNAADLWRAGDTSQRWLLEAAAAGEVFAAGHAESGNDIPVLLSTTKAQRVEGGYRFTGRKSFGSLSPVWTYLGIHGMDTADPSRPKIVHAFMPRETEGYRDRSDLGRAGDAGDAERRHHPRRRVRPRSLRRARRARGRRRHRSRSCSGSSRGRSSALATSTTASHAGRST